MVDFRSLVGGGGNVVEEIGMIRGLNRDFAEAQCERHADSVPCKNLIEAMSRLGLSPVAPAAAPTPAPSLGSPKIAAAPQLLVPKADADAAVSCARRCGIFGSLLGAALTASIPVETNGHADPNIDALSHAGAAAAGVASIALCARLCHRGDKVQPVAAPGSTYTLTGTYTHQVPSLEAVEKFSREACGKP